MSSLTPTARVILGMLKLGAPTGYEIKKAIDGSTRFFWTASFGQIYPELKRLQKEGLVRSKQEPRGKVKRTFYELTPKGEEALQEWLTDGGNMIFEVRDEGLLRLFFSDVLSQEDVLANLRVQQQVFELVLAQFREIEVVARGGVEDGLGYPYLVLRYGLDFITWARDWYAEVERKIEAGEPLFELDDDEAAGGEAGLRTAG
jgi:PadR family transcriptional regulator, regulatory protein AphA